MHNVTYTVICPYNPDHRFPARYEVEDAATGVAKTMEEYCPFCDKYVSVQIDQEVKPDIEILRRFGFDESTNL